MKEEDRKRLTTAAGAFGTFTVNPRHHEVHKGQALRTDR